MSAAAVTGMIFAGVFLAVLCVALALGGGMSRDKRKRVARVRARTRAATALRRETGSLVRNEGEARGLDRLLAGLLPRRAALRLRLARAGLAMSIGRYATISAGTALITAASLKVLLGLAPALALLIGLAVGILGPHLTLGWRIARRLARFNQLFPEAIDLMVRGLKSGLPVSETIVSVGEEMTEPVGGEFRAIADSVRLGATLDEALWETARRLDSPEFRFFAISLSVQRETGGNLAETLANLGDILRKRLTMRLKVKAMSSEARASAGIIGSLPFVMAAILMLLNPDYVMKLFTDPRGIIMTVIGLSMIGLGAGVMFKMVRFEV